MKIEKFLVTAVGIAAIVGPFTPQMSNAAVNIPHPVINISRPAIPKPANAGAVALNRYEKGGTLQP